jgi:hypothetical protein
MSSALAFFADSVIACLEAKAQQVVSMPGRGNAKKRLIRRQMRGAKALVDRPKEGNNWVRSRVLADLML